ncbi:MAG: hypothetical protein U5R49_02320 [Deltaproteobacteria bacterium]|nr:hypothetical protein [Deltaproteobacteria bacterium]
MPATWAGAGSKTAVAESEQIGLNISEFTNVDAMGFLAPVSVKPWGRIISDETEQIFLARGDTIYATFENGHDVKPGDIFTVYQSSDSVDHPLSGRDAGFVISFLGKIVLKKKVKNGLYEGEIVESYRRIQVGYPLLPFRPVSPCVRPIDPDWQRFESIQRGDIVLVAGKDLYEFLGQYSVVYLSHGVKSGVHRGNLFEIVGPAESKEAPDLTLGYLIVLESRPESATGIVIASKREFTKGATVWPVNLRESLHKIAVHYGVDLKKGCIVDTLTLLKEKVGSDLDLPEALRVISRLPTCLIK